MAEYGYQVKMGRMKDDRRGRLYITPAPIIQNVETTLAVVFLVILLAGCGVPVQAIQAPTTTPLAVKGEPLTKVDWSNFTYHSSCYGNTQPFKTKDGKARVNGISFQVYKPVFGDLTGDGQPEAAIPYSCAAADFAGVRVFVYSGVAAHPVLLGDLPLAGGIGNGNTWGSVQQTTINNQQITLSGQGYSASTPHCCPDLHITASYRWDGKQFVLVHASETPAGS
ncbi:MAG TPA: hypothetical protein VKV37_06175 [Ktedonobacteraceae bacterium]|nr:hypothetical protein [Ktedonobacteraceae bacterium]